MYHVLLFPPWLIFFFFKLWHKLNCVLSLFCFVFVCVFCFGWESIWRRLYDLDAFLSVMLMFVLCSFKEGRRKHPTWGQPYNILQWWVVSLVVPVLCYGNWIKAVLQILTLKAGWLGYLPFGRSGSFERKMSTHIDRIRHVLFAWFNASAQIKMHTRSRMILFLQKLWSVDTVLWLFP